MAIAGIKEVAQLASVSVGTVSNVLNRPEVVAPATRERVLNAMAELGFVRNEAARSLRAGKTHTLGLIVLDVTNPFFTDVAKGVEEVADAAGMIVTLCNSDQNAEREQRYLEHLEQQRAQGVLITPVDAGNRRLKELIERGTPVVLLDTPANRRSRCSVSVDDRLGGRLAAEHLLEEGHRRLAFVGGPLTLRQVAERWRGAEGAVREHGADAELELLEMPSLSVPSGNQVAQRLAETPAGQRPTAVMCANDLLALGVLHGLTMHGLRVPEDVALVGYDDIEYAAAAAVPLTSVRQPREELGRVAAELLLEEIDEEVRHRHRRVVFEPELVVRRSSRRSEGGTGDLTA